MARGVAEGEAGVELQAVGRLGQPLPLGEALRPPAAAESSTVDVGNGASHRLPPRRFEDDCRLSRYPQALARPARTVASAFRDERDGRRAPTCRTYTPVRRSGVSRVESSPDSLCQGFPTCAGVTACPVSAAVRACQDRQRPVPAAGTARPRPWAVPRLARARPCRGCVPSRCSACVAGSVNGIGSWWALSSKQQRVADDRLAALVHVADQVAGQAHAQALDEAGVPGLVGHLLARRG